MRFQKVPNRSRDKGGRLLQMPAARANKERCSGARDVRSHHARLLEDVGGASSARRTISAAALAAAMAPALPSRRLPERAALNPEARGRPACPVVVPRRSWENVVGIVLVASALSFVAGWFAAGPVCEAECSTFLRGARRITNETGCRAPTCTKRPRRTSSSDASRRTCDSCCSKFPNSESESAGTCDRTCVSNCCRNVPSEQPDKPR